MEGINNFENTNKARMSSLIARYNKYITNHFFFTNMASAVVIFTAGDVVAQNIEAYHHCKFHHVSFNPFCTTIDKNRLAKMNCWSLCFYTPFFMYYFRFLDRLVPAKTLIGTGKKVFGSFVLSPFVNSAFLCFGECWDCNKSQSPSPTYSNDEIKDRCKNKCEAELVNTIIASAALWWPLNAVNFGLVPSQYRSLTTSVFSVFWSCYLSLVAAR